MGALCCDGCGEESIIAHQPAFVDRKLPKTKQSGWRMCLLKSTRATRNTLTESNCRTDLREPGPFSRRWKSRMVL